MGRRRKSSDDAAAIAMAIIAAAVLAVAAGAIAIMAVFAVFGVLYGAGLSTVNFIKLIKSHLFSRSGSIESNAYVNYFHIRGDGVRNLKLICTQAFTNNLNTAGLAGKFIPKSGWFGQTLSAIFKVFTTISVFIVTVAYTPILVIALSAVFIPIWAGYVLLAVGLRSFEWVINNVYGLFNICKHCHKRIDLPVYKCPRCGARFNNLTSSVKFGPLYIKCKCGARLPASRFTGRNLLPAYCPHTNCGIQLSGQDTAPIAIAILGGPSSGKTQLMIDMTAVLIYRVFHDLKLSYAIPSDHRPEIDRMLEMFKNGVAPQITRDAMIDAVCVDVKSASWKYPQRIYFYDPPGESFSAVNKVSQHKYYANMLGAVFVLDPSTLEEVQKDYERNGTKFQIGQQGALRPEDSIERWLMSMERDFPGVVGKATCSVVINKTDEPSFSTITGLKAGATDCDCRKFLQRYGCDNLIKTLENSFRCVDFFAATFVGNGGNGKQFQPNGLSRMLNQTLRRCISERQKRNVRHILSLLWRPVLSVTVLILGMYFFIHWYSERLVIDSAEWRWNEPATMEEKEILKYFRNKKYESGDATFSDINTSNPEVLYYLACVYDSAQHHLYATGGKDDARAFEWYTFASDKGFAPAMVNLAMMYATGRGCAKDGMKARMLCNKAIALKYPRAHYVMGVNYRDGLWSSKNLSMAEACFKKSSSSGYLAARAALGELYVEGEEGIKQNVQKGLKFLTQAAENGEPMAQAKLGALYLRKEGPVARDVAKAEHWLKQAAHRGNSTGLSVLGSAYLSADEFSEHRGDAVFILEKAATKGESRAARLLGLIYEKGYTKDDFEIKQNMPASLKWFRVAAMTDPDSAYDVERVKTAMLQAGFSKIETMTDDEREDYKKRDAEKKRIREKKDAAERERRAASAERERKAEELRMAEVERQKTLQARKSCLRCSGSGKVKEVKECWRCNGTSEIESEADCDTCGGKGTFHRRIYCTKCSGKGKVMPRCNVCNNTGKVKCWNCNGTGGQYERSYRQGIGGRNISMRKTFVKCTSCGGSGKERCSSCSGYKVDCSTCSGAGTLLQSYPCGSCNGHGKVKHKEPCDNSECIAGLSLVQNQCPSCSGTGRLTEYSNEKEDRIARTKCVIGELKLLIERYKKAYDRENPPDRLQDLGILKVGVNTKDGWGRELSFEVNGYSYAILSAGADGRFGTGDDLSIVCRDSNTKKLNKVKRDDNDRVKRNTESESRYRSHKKQKESEDDFS